MVEGGYLRSWLLLSAVLAGSVEDTAAPALVARAPRTRLVWQPDPPEAQQLSKVVGAARALGLAPYRWLSSGQYSSSSTLLLLSTLVLSLTLVGAVEWVNGYQPQWADGGVALTCSEELAALLLLLRAALFLLALWARQYPDLLDILNSSSFQSHLQQPLSLLLPALFSISHCIVVVPMIFLIQWNAETAAHSTLTTAFLCMWIVYIGQDMLLSYLIECLYSQIGHVNSALRSMPAYCGGCSLEALRALRIRYTALAHLADQFSSAFGPYFIVTFLADFWIIVKCCFVIMNVTHLSTLLACNASGLLTCTSLYILSVWLMDRLKSMVEEKKNMVREAQTVISASSEERHELADRSQQMTRWPIAFRTCGIMEINLTSLFHAVALAVTYLIVLLELCQSSA